MRKKIFLGIIAVLLISAISVAGTMAWLTAQSSTTVTNTFTKGKGLWEDTNGKLELYEDKATKNADNSGKYTLNTSLPVTENTYEVTPFVDLNKRPYVKLTNKSALPAYLYIEVSMNLPNNVTANVDSSIWTQLMSGSNPVKGKNNGNIYYLKNNSGRVTGPTSGSITYDILQGNIVNVEDTSAVTFGSNTIQIWAYLVQATAGDTALAAWNVSGFQKT